MRTAVRFTLATILTALLSIPALSAAEFRGLYVDAFHPGFKTHEQVTQMVNAAKGANFNALIVQVRKRGDAYYNSSIEPKAADMAAEYDPLADVIAQAHAAGLEVHAWLTVYEVMHDSKWYNPAPNHVYNTHPEWLMKDREGNTTLAGQKIYLDPGVPEVQDYVVAVVLDILNSYRVDGIYLDGPRYPGRHSGYNPTSVSLFNEQFERTGLPEGDDSAWCQWRQDQITSLVGAVRAAMASAKPQAKFLVSACAEDGEKGKRLFLQEWDAWSGGNLVDSMIPMLYIGVDGMSWYASTALWYRYQRHMYIGVGAFRLSPTLACKHIQDTREAGADGVVLYSYHYLGPNSGSATCVKMADLASSVFAQPASVPEMPWKQ